MGTMRIGRRARVGLLLAIAVASIGCTSDSDIGAENPDASTTTLPEDQKPPLLRESWTPEDLERLAEIDVSDYEGELVDLTDTVLERAFVSSPDPEGITLTIRVRLAPCDEVACWDLTQDPSDEEVARLRAQLPAAARDDPDLVLEYGPDDLVGDFEGFALSYRSFSPDGQASTIGYRVLYHDGLNFMEADASPSSAPDPADDDALVAQMPREWAEEVTADVFAAFADEFNVDG